MNPVEEKNVPVTEQPKKKAGRKPMTDKQKAEAAKARAEIKKKADSMKPEVILQYQGMDADVNALIEQAKAQFKSVKKRTPITEMSVYLKPEERKMYYVINGEYNGSVEY